MARCGKGGVGCHGRRFQFIDKRLFEHDGEELMFVLSGNVEVEVSGKFYRLSEGDTLYFDAHLSHRSRSLGKKYAEVLIVVTGIK